MQHSFVLIEENWAVLYVSLSKKRRGSLLYLFLLEMFSHLSPFGYIEGSEVWSSILFILFEMLQEPATEIRVWRGLKRVSNQAEFTSCEFDSLSKGAGETGRHFLSGRNCAIATLKTWIFFFLDWKRKGNRMVWICNKATDVYTL